MKYSNGFDADIVLPALTNRIGWRSQNDVPVSGRFFEDFHALSQTDHLKSTQAKADISDSDFTAYLSSLKSAVIARCLNGVFNEPECIEEVILRDRVINNQDTPIQNTSSFVGYRIRVASAFDIAVFIRYVTLYFDQAVTFNLYLFKEGVHQPIKTIPVTTVANDATTIDLSAQNIALSYSYGKSGIYYLGYFQSDLSGAHALNEVSVFNTTICFEAIPCIAQALSSTTFNQRMVAGTNFPYGLNFQMASIRDFTGLIVKNAFLFDELIGLTMTYQVLEQILFNTRSNSSERRLNENIQNGVLQLELQGTIPASDAPQITSLGKRIEREAQRVKKAFYPKAQAVSLTYADC